ncbi:LemA family protein [Vicingus serpentipes]|uniref:LemA family protein n=1 Tax=Vicingus serpentipes TaxID=1926625 RepID=A0A5C6RVK1_9FLAO|nr:LemA family protein [Vicingus serpentipes]TXB65985.1 LemA family protein [Vicingus serpentipes]
MKKSLIILGVVALIIMIAISSIVGSYNNMVTMDESVSGQWSQVENVYQRRADLIPNLVNTVKGYASHEKETLEGVIEARSKATQTTIDPSKLNAESIKQFAAAQDGLSSALSKLMVVVERYPDLKANQNFLELQAQLEGTENRISVERKKFNDTAKEYNTFIRKFPKNIWAGMFGFEKRDYFEAQAGAEKAPEVQF